MTTQKISKLSILALITLSDVCQNGYAESLPQYGSQGVSTNVLEIPIHPKSCLIAKEIHVPSRIRSAFSHEVRSSFPRKIVKLHVAVGQEVKKGQRLATVDTSYVKKIRDIYEDYLNLYSSEMNVLQRNLKLIQDRVTRVRGLVEKGILPSKDLEDAGKALTQELTNKETVSRLLGQARRNFDNYDEQMRGADFYAEIDGVITFLIVDPKILLGPLDVMPEVLVARIEKPGVYLAQGSLNDLEVHQVKKTMKTDVILPDGQVFEGRINYISKLPKSELPRRSNSSDDFKDKGAPKASQTYVVNVEFSRSGDILPSGLLADVRMLATEDKVKLCLPWNAIDVVDGKSFVRILKDGVGWARKPITLGKSGRYDVEVASGLDGATMVMSKLW